MVSTVQQSQTINISSSSSSRASTASDIKGTEDKRPQNCVVNLTEYHLEVQKYAPNEAKSLVVVIQSASLYRRNGSRECLRGKKEFTSF